LKIIKLLLLIFAVTLFSQNIAHAYILIPENCRSDQEKCLKSGEMDYIFVYGKIIPSDAHFFEQLDAVWPSDKKIPIIWLESEGGSVAAAEQIGVILRQRHGVVATGNPITKTDRFYCVSSCVLIAAGAEERHLRHIGLHSPYILSRLNSKKETVLPYTEDGWKRSRAYFKQMGFDPEISDIIYKTPYDSLVEYEFDEAAGNNQPIVKLGFHMTPSIDFPDDGFPKAETHRDQYEDEKLQFAAENGNLDAAIALSEFYEKGGKYTKREPELAKEWMEFAADRGNIQAIHNLAAGLRDKNKRFGIIDINRSNELYKKASDLGFGPSQNNLGWYYYTGTDGVPKNIPLAIQLITSSALNGEPFAYGSLCQIYGDGHVFPKDNVTAYMWCDLALDQMPHGSGFKDAQASMTKITRNMNSAEIMEGRQRSANWKPLKYPSNYLRGDGDD
jgi:TPR repeat protein